MKVTHIEQPGGGELHLHDGNMQLVTLTPEDGTRVPAILSRQMAETAFVVVEPEREPAPV